MVDGDPRPHRLTRAHRLNDVIGVRDSKAPDSGHLALSPPDFAHLIAAVKRGQLHP
ncbi:DUF397 domain-containing protein [Spirillospora sp. NPDC048832]